MKKNRWTKILILVSGILFSLSSELYPITNCSEPIKTDQGLIQGKEDAKGSVCVWKGIPYAQPPVGDLRWREPQPVKPHSGILKAFDFSPACPQKASITSGGEFDRFSEDCLYLNIWAPKINEGSSLSPVMFWIHGGRFQQGTAGYDIYDGARLAGERGVVIVTINYRLGALGFLSLPELAQESPKNSAGNYGLLDQLEALKWVKKNIKAFGGDPNNVTIFGQSAGGMSVCAHLVSPLSEGLFHKAIIISGSCELESSREKAFEIGTKFAEQMKCSGPDRLNCLRNLPADSLTPQVKNLLLVMFSETVIPSPSIDGYFLSDQPIHLIRQGKYHKVPVIIENTRDEIQAFTMFFPGLSLLPPSFFNRLFKKLVGEDITEQLMNYYSYSDYKYPSDCAFAIANDAFISRGFLAAEALASQTPVFLSRFDWDETRFGKKAGAFHGLNEPFIFGALNSQSRLAKLLANKKAIESGRPLSEKMMTYYTNFAKTGNPNSGALPFWPQYTLETKERIYFDSEIKTAPLSELEIKRYNFFGQYSFQDLTQKLKF